jgi:hypothetical protein
LLLLLSFVRLRLLLFGWLCLGLAVCADFLLLSLPLSELLY